jgi:SAM-dependent methyltransferase
MSKDKSASGELFRRWNLYESIILENWMRHREISSAIQNTLADLHGPIRVLDLGCGDGWMAARCLTATQVTRYVGVDLSDAALQILASCGGMGIRPQEMQLDLMCEDMSSAAARLASQSFEVVLASYAIHHLLSPSKQRLLEDISRLLEMGGIFLWTDLACGFDESPGDYLQRLTHHIDIHWTNLPPVERHSAIEHILKCDYPEQPDWMHATAAQSGLSLRACLFQDEFFGCWSYVKQA